MVATTPNRTRRAMYVGTCRSNDRGVTLVEMLTVIAIVGVLTGMVAPIVCYARAKGRAVTCAYNLKSVGQAYAAFLQESSTYMPDAFYTFDDSEDVFWIELRDQTNSLPDKFIQHLSRKILTCPSDDSPANVLGATSSGEGTVILSSYGYNAFLPLITGNASRISDAARTVTFYDGDPTLVVGKEPFSVGWAEDTVCPRHMGQANFLFLDGHVEIGDFPAYASGFALRGVALSGTINVNPNNSGNKNAPRDIEFSLVLRDGTEISHETLLANEPLPGPGFATEYFEYEGPATMLKIKPKAPGRMGEFTFNGKLFFLPVNKATVFHSGDMVVHIYNDHQATKGKGQNNAPMGHWWIEIESGAASVLID